MRTLTICTLALSLAIPGAFAQGKGKGRGRGPARPGLTLTSTAFPDGSEIPVKYTSAAPMPISPELNWTNVPMGTVTFALLMHDPDVAFNRSIDTDVTHWIVWNIPGTARGLHENMPATAQMPDGTIQGKNQGNVAGYRGPGAPAAGPPHHYTWELYALDTKLDLGPDATRAEVIKAINGHVLAKALFMGRFKRPN
jgi:Raf kinase inhibitor-like YbhB/YbcL family protein